ncbi:MAG: hypothetical protein ABID38_03265 [Candidatus Diapherotrites archaeon]
MPTPKRPINLFSAKGQISFMNKLFEAKRVKRRQNRTEGDISYEKIWMRKELRKHLRKASLKALYGHIKVFEDLEMLHGIVKEGKADEYVKKLAERRKLKFTDAKLLAIDQFSKAVERYQKLIDANMALNFKRMPKPKNKRQRTWETMVANAKDGFAHELIGGAYIQLFVGELKKLKYND